jgi:hypothetical protein
MSYDAARPAPVARQWMSGGEPLADTWLVRCGRLPHRSQQRNTAAARPATVFAMPAVGLPSVDPSSRERAGTRVP